MIPDRVVAATYLAAVGMAGGEVTVADARPDHMEMLLRKLRADGRRASTRRPTGSGRARRAAARRRTSPRSRIPGVATDYSRCS